jgi:NAD(P)-dependent dehydrogenase (short-subunit alcohol dehydrogenase family)
MSGARTAVVTGAGAGIGRAIATRLAASGAQVVVNDIDAAAARQVAAAIGGVAVPGDAATAAGVAHLVQSARDALGQIDTYVANAGIAGGLGLEASDAVWSRAMDVNVMAHVRAARLLVPEWLERGHGRFVATASAAGLLTMLGSPTYAVSKHAAVAFAEWLSVTYGARGIVVQVLCPLGVETDMLTSSGPLQQVLRRDPVLSPEQVAGVVWEAFDDDRFLILPHEQVREYYRHRASDTETWLAGMRMLQSTLDDAARPPS